MFGEPSVNAWIIFVPLIFLSRLDVAIVLALFMIAGLALLKKNSAKKSVIICCLRSSLLGLCRINFANH